MNTYLLKRMVIWVIPLSLVVILLVSGQKVENNHIIDNELTKNQLVEPSRFYCNPLLLDGKPLDNQSFNLDSKGELTLVTGDPESTDAVQIPFYLELQPRDGIKDLSTLYYTLHPVYSVDVSKVLANAKGGDKLIITPSSPVDWKAKRVLTISGC